MLKKCSKCRKSLSLKYFYKDKSRKDGLTNYCKLCWTQRCQKYRNKNKVKVIERRQIYYKNHKKIASKQNKTWDKNNPARRLVIYNKYRARENAAPGNFTEIDWNKQYKLQNGQCFYCGLNKKLTIDHKMPLSKGGSNRPENIVLACKECNSSKRDKPFEEFLVYIKINKQIMTKEIFDYDSSS